MSGIPVYGYIPNKPFLCHDLNEEKELDGGVLASRIQVFSCI